MSNSPKSLSELARGLIVDIPSTSVVDRAFELQRSAERASAFSMPSANILDQIVGRLPSGESRFVLDVVGGKLGVFDAIFRKISAIELGNRCSQRVSNILEAHETHSSAATAFRGIGLGIDWSAAGALTRAHHWADLLIGSSGSDYAGLLGIGGRYAKQFEELNHAAGSIAAVVAAIGAGDFATRAGMLGGGVAGLCATATKMSLFAGSLDVLGPSAGASQAAFTSLLGGYSTSAIIDRPYWRAPGERTRYYRELEVDEGLIDADNAATIAVLIDSGVVEGQRTRGGALTAVVDAGPVKVRITANRPKSGAFGAIDAFENRLRAFVAAKLSAAQGPSWFKQRVPGDIVKRAKDRRHEAMRAGEAPLELINYTDLGDLISVITRNDNWTEVFEAVFDRAEWLRVDLERLTASRRPTMHSRPVDPVRLCEIVFTIRRLGEWMDRDGAWGQGWDDDI